MPRPAPPPGFVQLLLLPQDSFYLEVPMQIATTVCLYPLKYLRYVGWCVLGVSGTLVDETGDAVELDGELVDREVYRYDVPGGNILSHAVDPEVIKQRTHTHSATTATRENFREKVLKRDGRCVWTGIDEGVGMHIIPYARGDEACPRIWIQLIIENRPTEENLSSLRSINDIRNGFYATSDIHFDFFDQQKVAVLVTPNPILETTDIPNRYQRPLEYGVSYPPDSRYTLQWITTPSTESTRARIPNNNDATFAKHRLQKPARLLLHYRYGAAAVKNWGKNVAVLIQHHQPNRPPVPTPAPMGPPKAKHDHGASIKKREKRKREEEREGAGAGMEQAGGRNEGGTSAVTAVESEAQNIWDEHDVMLFFWGNSKAARERHAKEEADHREYLEKWRSGIPRNSPNV
ncbi:uncharacterized protein BT62DRAFT_976986 [Guyanagaster necrorhizus]|uniref:HNH nuclease domain-containing protein n=1 Tax=Guyanagaster necrorhizus TaxID=856835 RepID=A0A9P7VER8_9AGAR|nr:uncharacterized protein BT62DRAFT_976986 [Guyanagaster necrorhizus MCA 3950]KAG7439223.1 hypothetical protein BT62DRAFT_976986 [Guyanagaster necrorhizus MCA 3950]